MINIWEFIKLIKEHLQIPFRAPVVPYFSILSYSRLSPGTSLLRNSWFPSPPVTVPSPSHQNIYTLMKRNGNTLTALFKYLPFWILLFCSTLNHAPKVGGRKRYPPSSFRGLSSVPQLARIPLFQNKPCWPFRPNQGTDDHRTFLSEFLALCSMNHFPL